MDRRCTPQKPDFAGTNPRPPEHDKLLEHREEAPSENQRLLSLRKVAQVDTGDYGEIRL